MGAGARFEGYPEAVGSREPGEEFPEHSLITPEDLNFDEAEVTVPFRIGILDGIHDSPLRKLLLECPFEALVRYGSRNPDLGAE